MPDTRACLFVWAISREIPYIRFESSSRGGVFQRSTEKILNYGHNPIPEGGGIQAGVMYRDSRGV